MSARRWIVLLIALRGVPALAAEGSAIDADASIVIGYPSTGSTAVKLDGSHSATLTRLDPADKNREWDLRGRLLKNGFLVVEEDNCSKTAKVSVVSQSCKTEKIGVCAAEYKVETDAEIISLWGGGLAHDSKSALGHMPCVYASTPIPPPTAPWNPSPIVLDLDGRGFRFTSAEAGVSFDIDGDGQEERLSWTDPAGDDSFLVLDRNGNGRIDDGRELFGNFTVQPPSEDPNGFAALRVFDQPLQGGNGDGLITAADAVFSRLRLWRDANQDGRSQAAELASLAAARIDLIELDYRISDRSDRYGNRLHWFSEYLSRGRHYPAVDVIFVAAD